ncbi:MAG: hypothetical protein WDM91_05770 [Rhizomicrobium sp.]
MSFRVIVTDANYRPSIALAQYAKRAIPDLHLIGHSTGPSYPARWYSCYDEIVSDTPLAPFLQSAQYDMVIPVGADSVLATSAVAPDKAVLPPRDKIEICFDKVRTLALAREQNVPFPATRHFERGQPLDFSGIAFPCVVKAARENARGKVVRYCDDEASLKAEVAKQLETIGGNGGLLVQERIDGSGAGLFALCDRGKPLRVFMHQRLREYPPTGGISVAARAFYSERLKELGLRLLAALEWHGVAMVEFRRSHATGEFVLMEINGKFWGSLELSLAAGVNFAADLIRFYRGETLEADTGFDRDCEFYWPLDGDILTLWKTGALGKMRDYWRPNAHTNLGGSLMADARKSLALVYKAITT